MAQPKADVYFDFSKGATYTKVTYLDLKIFKDKWYHTHCLLDVKVCTNSANM